jgi:hypothetical protein
MTRTAPPHSRNHEMPRLFQQPGHGPYFGHRNYKQAGRNRSGNAEPPPGSQHVPAVLSRRTRPMADANQPGRSRIDPPAVFHRSCIIDCPRLWPTGRPTACNPRRCLPQSLDARCLSFQPLRAATRRHVGSGWDRSRSNVQRSVISVTASVPVSGFSFTSFV